MLVGNPKDYALTVLLVALSGGAIASLYLQSRALALLAALSMSLLSRQTLSRSQMVVDTARAYRSREQALQQVSDQIRHERTDERRLIAAELHDEVLQPLFKVTLMAHVLKADLAGGRLLDLDQDVPELLTAADLASTTLRELIGDLRRSALGRGGLSPALKRFLQFASEHASSRLHEQIESVKVDAEAELVIYQIAKEAVANSLSHSRAENVWVTLRQYPEGVELTVIDDGMGFDPANVPDGHYGLHIMRERACSVGANFSLESSSGKGSTLTLIILTKQLPQSAG
jgi:signal transduction histidine kinase